MRQVTKAEAMPRVFQMLVDFQLGRLRAEDYSDLEWAGFQDATLQQVLPAIVDDPELPSVQEVKTGMAKLSPQISVGRTIAELKSVPDHRLEQYRNEAQWLSELLSPPENRADPLTLDEFISFFKARHLNPDGERNMATSMRALGHTHPPGSPIERWLAAGRAVASRSPTPTSSPAAL
jgi:hypothetical protein